MFLTGPALVGEGDLNDPNNMAQRIHVSRANPVKVDINLHLVTTSNFNVFQQDIMVTHQDSVACGFYSNFFSIIRKVCLLLPPLKMKMLPTFTVFPLCTEEKPPHSMILPPLLCFTVRTAVLCLRITFQVDAWSATDRLLHRTGCHV